MSREEAPLYVRAFDLARDLHARVATWPEPSRATLGAPLAAEARTLVSSVALSLAFPEDRPGHQRAADEALLRLRVLLRLAAALELVSEGAARAAHGELTDIGRMLGGWRKRERRRVGHARTHHPENPP